MSNEQKARQCVDSIVERQIGGTRGPKSEKRVRTRHMQKRRDRPLNVLGCFALIHAIRSMKAGERSRIGTRRATAA
jgi:hypothetical protein